MVRILTTNATRSLGWRFHSGLLVSCVAIPATAEAARLLGGRRIWTGHPARCHQIGTDEDAPGRRRVGLVLRTVGGRDRPEEKHHVIGEGFVCDFDLEATDVDANYLIQGTIHPNRIESEGGMKSRYAVGDPPIVVDFDGIDVTPSGQVRSTAMAVAPPALVT